jgi:hypothetical protein
MHRPKAVSSSLAGDHKKKKEKKKLSGGDRYSVSAVGARHDGTFVLIALGV